MQRLRVLSRHAKTEEILLSRFCNHPSRSGYIGNLFILFLAFTIFGFAALHAESPVQHTGGAAQKQDSATPSDFVGSTACLTCHKDVNDQSSSGPHSSHTHNGKNIPCETCHGPGRKHVESGGDTANIFVFKGAQNSDEDGVCLRCHAGSLPNFKDSAHREADVGCVGCHSIHAFTNEKLLLKQPETTLCETCHRQVKSAFEQPSHHKVNEGAIACTDCHDPHSTDRAQGTIAVAHQNQICINCHNDAAGPFVDEHPPVKTEGCISCHAPHGSKSPQLLTMATQNDLCTQCHTATPNYTEPGTKPVHDQKTLLQPCTSCHSQIHGSNTSRFFFK